MNSHQENRLKMFMAVRDYLLKNSAITATLPNFQGPLTSLQNLINEVQNLQVLNQTSKDGIADSKNQVRANLIGQMVDISRSIAAYATMKNNLVLLKEVKFTESELKRTVDTILRDDAQLLYDRGLTHLTNLAEYGIAESLLATFLDTIHAFNASIPQTRLGVVEKKQSGKQIASLLNEAEDCLYKIGMLVEMVRRKQSQFYQGFRDVRRTIELGGNSLAVYGHAREKLNGKPIRGVKVQFALNGSDTAVHSEVAAAASKVTAQKGGFRIKSLPEGTYQVTAYKLGYKEQKQNVNIISGELAQIYLELEKA